MAGPDKSLRIWDIDGTLIEFRTDYDWMNNDKPVQHMIDKLIEQYNNGDWIVLYTARREVIRTQTEELLKALEIPYHLLCMSKSHIIEIYDDADLDINHCKNKCYYEVIE